MSQIEKIDPNFKLSTLAGHEDVVFYNCLQDPFKVYGLIIPEGERDYFIRIPEEVARNVAIRALEYMKEQGVASEITTFLENEAVHSAYTQDEVFCQEMLFAYNGSFYAIALRGGDEETFQSLLETVIINEATASA